MNKSLKLIKDNLIKIQKVTPILLVFVIISLLPYGNTIINPLNLLLIIYFIIAIYLNLSSRVSILFGLTLLVLCIPWVFVGSRVRIEQLAVTSFILFVFAFFQEAVTLRGDK